MNFTNILNIFLKVAIGFVLIAYMSNAAHITQSYDYMPEYLNKVFLSLFITYGSIKLSTDLYEKGRAFLRYIFKDNSHGRPFN